MGPNYVDFTFAFDTTLIRLEMTEIWPKYVAQAKVQKTWDPSEEGFTEKLALCHEFPNFQNKNSSIIFM